MKKIKILWLSNVDLTNKSPNQSGTWIHSMYKAVTESGAVEVCANITTTSKGSYYSVVENGTAHHYVPNNDMRPNSKPSSSAKEYVVSVILENVPDIIHVWGLELPWGLIMGDKRLADFKKLLEIQGIKSVCADSNYYWAGLSQDEFVSMRSLLQKIVPIRRLERTQKKYKEWQKVEKEILGNIDNINTQSDWVRSVLPSIADMSNKIIHKTGIILRDSFIKSAPWIEVHEENEDPILFTTTSSLPYKGLHVTLKALSLLRIKYPTIKLYVAGMKSWNPNLIRGGYTKYIYNLVKELNLEDAVVFLGNINEEEMKKYMYQADVFVISSFVESYCLALAEGLAIGVPTVASYSTALTELINNGENGLLYPVGDYYICASKISYILDNFEFAKKISDKSSTSYRKHRSNDNAVKMQLDTYQAIIRNCK